MDMPTGMHNVKQGVGAVGILTAGLVTRQQAYEVLVAYALVPLLDHGDETMERQGPAFGTVDAS